MLAAPRDESGLRAMTPDGRRNPQVKKLRKDGRRIPRLLVWVKNLGAVILTRFAAHAWRKLAGDLAVALTGMPPAFSALSSAFHGRGLGRWPTMIVGALERRCPTSEGIRGLGRVGNAEKMEDAMARARLVLCGFTAVPLAVGLWLGVRAEAPKTSRAIPGFTLKDTEGKAVSLDSV